MTAAAATTTKTAGLINVNHPASTDSTDSTVAATGGEDRRPDQRADQRPDLGGAAGLRHSTNPLIQ
jgi:hypothetical protein